MEQETPIVNSVIVTKYDGAAVSKDEEIAVTTNFPMWFGEDIINEINEKEITVVVVKDHDNKNHIHLATQDTDLIMRSQIAFWRFAR